MREIVFSEQRGTIRNAFSRGGELLLLYGCSLPDVCVGCGNPAYGNVERKEFFPLPFWWFVLPPGLDLLAQIVFAKRFLFDFPFCSNCPPDGMKLSPVRLGMELVVFSGASKKVLELLPGPPPEVLEERERSLIARQRWRTR